MVNRKTTLLKTLNDTKGLVKLVSPGDTVNSFTIKLEEIYGIDLTEKELDQFCRKYIGKSYSGLLNYLKNFSKVDNGSEERPNTRSKKGRKYRNIGALPKTKGKGRIINYGNSNRAI